MSNVVNYFIVQGLPDEGLDLNTRDRNGCTPLHVALLSGASHGMQQSMVS